MANQDEATIFVQRAGELMTRISQNVEQARAVLGVMDVREYGPGEANEILDTDIVRNPGSPIRGNMADFFAAMEVMRGLLTQIDGNAMSMTFDKIRQDY